MDASALVHLYLAGIAPVQQGLYTSAPCSVHAYLCISTRVPHHLYPRELGLVHTYLIASARVPHHLYPRGLGLVHAYLSTSARVHQCHCTRTSRLVHECTSADAQAHIGMFQKFFAWCLSVLRLVRLVIGIVWLLYVARFKKFFLLWLAYICHSNVNTTFLQNKYGYHLSIQFNHLFVGYSKR